MNARASRMHGKAANRRKQLGQDTLLVCSGYSADRPVGARHRSSGWDRGQLLRHWAVALPFEIIYLHQARGFPTATAGLVLAAVIGTAAVVTPFFG